MRKFTCAIIDDEPLACELIEGFVNQIDFISNEAIFSESMEAIIWLKKNPVDFVFLDIQMPDMDGMEFARLLPESIKIIFTTAFREYALESYEVSAVDFLLKPIRFEKVLRACEKVREWYNLNEYVNIKNNNKDITEIFLKVNGEIRRIGLDQILYIEGMKDYVKIVLKNDKPIISYLRMKNLEEILPFSKFLRINKSYIVSLSNIRTLDNKHCLYIGDIMIRISEQYKNSFDEWLKDRMIQ